MIIEALQKKRFALILKKIGRQAVNPQKFGISQIGDESVLGAAVFIMFCKGRLIDARMPDNVQNHVKTGGGKTIFYRRVTQGFQKSVRLLMIGKLRGFISQIERFGASMVFVKQAKILHVDGESADGFLVFVDSREALTIARDTGLVEDLTDVKTRFFIQTAGGKVVAVDLDGDVEIGGSLADTA